MDEIIVLLWVLASVVSIIMIVLFINLCIDVKKIRRLLYHINSNTAGSMSNMGGSMSNMGKDIDLEEVPCDDCIHYEGNATCKAFPNGIPKAIISGGSCTFRIIRH